MVSWDGKPVVSTESEGITVYDGATWTNLIAKGPKQLALLGDNLVVYLDDWGLWYLDCSDWSPVYARSLGDIQLGTWGDKLIVNFISLGGAYGPMTDHGTAFISHLPRYFRK